ncbi:MAG: hypothetical protein PHF86_07635 [Candidatus Nanoarchaeia archaeon]|jgi:hypothetical protein|nr:hypothetical protein [Candidatus Nanoarchaeia archaeon]
MNEKIEKIIDEILGWCGIEPENSEKVIDIVDEAPGRYLRRNDNFLVRTMSKVKKTNEDIINDFLDWFGPNGECWCDEKNKFVDPDECPDYAMLRDTGPGKTYRYLHLHDDYKSY